MPNTVTLSSNLLELLRSGVYYGISIGIFFAASLFVALYLLTLLNKRQPHNFIKVLLLACLAFLFFGFFNIYSLPLHFAPIVQLLPDFFFVIGKFSAPISLALFTAMYISTVPVQTLDSFLFWQRYRPIYNGLYLLDVIATVALFFIHDYHTVLLVSLLLFIPHCLIGVFFSIFGMVSVKFNRFYGVLFTSTTALLLIYLYLLGSRQHHLLPGLFFVITHLLLAIMVLSFSVITIGLHQAEINRFQDYSLVKINDFFRLIFNALTKDEFYLLYQPKINIHNNEVCGIEALIRWQHPSRGEMPPADFIPAAEQNETIGYICMWVIHNALKDLSKLISKDIHVPMSINFSVKNLNLQTVQYLLDKMHQYRIPNYLVVIEITETLLLHLNEEVEKALHLLHKNNIYLSLDDFGSGFASLNLIERLGIQEIKIDKEFILNIEHNKKNFVIVSSTLDMGFALGINVLAEGVENQNIKAILKDMNCKYAQGFGLAQPMHLREFIHWYQTQGGKI